MKTPSQSSPFAALTLKEQQEKWIVWQSQHPAIESIAAQAEAMPPVHLPKADNSSTTRPQPEVSTPPKAPATNAEKPLPQVRHSQYDAVLRRIAEAGKRAGAWHSVT